LYRNKNKFDMNHPKYILLLLFVFVCFGFNHSSQGKKLALIVAIGNYPAESGWKSISSLNDIPLILPVLEKQGFDDIVILKDEQGDKNGIVTALNDLIKKTNKNDLVFIHFSSHGQQIMDLDGDEIDGFDEAIVPYGAPAYYSDNEDFKKHLSDDEFGEIIEKLRAKLGKDGDLLITIDACHSGTATRGDGITRGGMPPLAPENYNPTVIKDKKASFVSQNTLATRGNSNNLSPMVVISGAAPDELNYEYQGVGSLSLALNRAFSRATSNFTYRTLFSQVIKEMSIIAPRQNPMIEGDIDRELFGGRVVNQEAYFTISNLDNDAIRIDLGIINGINEGTTVSVHPAGTVSTKGLTPLAEGKVTYAEPLNATIILDKPIEGIAEDYWVFVKDRTFGDIRTLVTLGKFQNNLFKNKLMQLFSNSSTVKLTDNNPTFIIEEENNFATIRFVSSGEYFHKNIPLGDDLTILNETLMSYTQGVFLKQLELNNSDYEVELQFIPVKVVGRQVVDTLDIKDFIDANGTPTFTPKDRVLLKVINRSNFPIYFNIIDIQPDGIINAIVPDPRKNESLEEYRLEAGQSHILRGRYIGFGPPYGLETFKTFVSYQPLNLTPIVRSKGTAATRGNLSNKIEILFSDAFSLHRGANLNDLSGGIDAATFSFPFNIAPD
jgi:hypothetical protein